MNLPKSKLRSLPLSPSVMHAFAALLIASAPVWADSADATRGAKPADVASTDTNADHLQKILTAFARNDEVTGRKLAQEFLDMKGVVIAPKQMQVVQLLLRVSVTPTLKDESPDEAKARAEAIKVAADLKGVLAQLERIEATARTMPKSGFSAGGPTHQRWIQMGEERGRLWEQRDKFTKRQGELVAEYNAAHTARLGSVETVIIYLAKKSKGK